VLQVGPTCRRLNLLGVRLWTSGPCDDHSENGVHPLAQRAAEGNLIHMELEARDEAGEEFAYQHAHEGVWDQKIPSTQNRKCRA
jgi:hypothetical protein